jgi:hypothetical protein
MPENFPQSSFKRSMAPKALLLFCLLPVALCAVAHEAMSLSFDAVSPTVRIDQAEFF